MIVVVWKMYSSEQHLKKEHIILKSQFESQVKMDKSGQRLKSHEQIESLERIQVNKKQILTSDHEIFEKKTSLMYSHI